jgi:hypothetical protein
MNAFCHQGAKARSGHLEYESLDARCEELGQRLYTYLISFATSWRYILPPRREGTKWQLEYKSLDAFFDQWNVEIDQESEALSRELEVTENLRIPNCVVFINCLQFTYDKIVDQHIEPQAFVKNYFAIPDWQVDLPLSSETQL